MKCQGADVVKQLILCTALAIRGPKCIIKQNLTQMTLQKMKQCEQYNSPQESQGAHELLENTY